MSEFRVPFQAADSEFVEKRSRFISHIWPVETEEQAQQYIKDMKARYYAARHNCWCYRVGPTTARYSVSRSVRELKLLTCRLSAYRQAAPPPIMVSLPLSRAE